jgi:hypothetical protein
MLYVKEPESKPSKCGKIKPVLRERGLEIPRQKSSRSFFFCHPNQIPGEILLKKTRENMGIKQIWFLECKACEHIYDRKNPMQCKQT